MIPVSRQRNEIEIEKNQVADILPSHPSAI